MSDRRKYRALRRSKMDLNFTRRVITDAKEKDRVHGEMQDDVARVEEELKNEKEAAIAQRNQAEEDASARHEKEDGWVPYESEQDIARWIARLHPTWDILTVIRTAKGMWSRYPLVRAALIAGIRQGNSLREQAAYGRGWWWPELGVLTPQERGQVIAQVRRTVLA